LLSRLIALDGAPIDEPRPADQRVVGTCRHFAVLSCAFLRAHGFPARARCGFATYFHPGLSVDHWITEYWAGAEKRWVRIDSEIVGLDEPYVPHPNDLAPGEFLSGGEAWALCRRGASDPMTYGVHGTDHAWGPAEIIGNAIRDLAALNKVEMLPWDEWGPMDECYRREIRPETEALIDAIADACAADDGRRIAELYGGLAVPEDMVS
jgi:Transglutaminase-like superfamily